MDKSTKMVLPTKVKSFSIGDRAGIELLDDSTVWSWGADKPRYESDVSPWQDISKNHYPEKVIKGKVNRVMVGQYSAVAYMEDSTIKIWGNGYEKDLVGGLSTYKNIRTLYKIIAKNGIVIPYKK